MLTEKSKTQAIMKNTLYMKQKSYLRRSIVLLMCLTVSLATWAQSPKKPVPAIKRGNIILRAGENTKASVQEKTAPAKASAPKAAKKRNAKQAPAKRKTPRKTTAPTSDRYIALKTNVPFLALAVQNLALEVQCHEHISIDLPVIWSISDIEREHALRTFTLQPEARWWMKTVGEGHFFGLHTHISWFNLKWEQDRYQSGKRPLLGAGISYGYKLPLSQHWGAEFNIGAGYANMKYNTYYNVENGAKIDTRIRNYWGITRIGLSLVYRF